MLEMVQGDDRGNNFPKAQAIKDATMGYFTAQNYHEYSFYPLQRKLPFR